MSRTLLAAMAAMSLAIRITEASAQDLPNWPIRNEIDREVYDTLAIYWGDNPPADQCALDRIKERHITKTWPNLLDTFNACQSKQLEEQQNEGNDK
jgi:hypothetical protein